MKRPWNIIDSPVYSLATYDDTSVNMNICTYVTAVSMQPKLYAIAVYKGTKTLSNLKSASKAILQILHPKQISLVKLLGKKSGFKFHKEIYLEKKDLLQIWNNCKVLHGCSALMLLKKISSEVTGDHELFIFEAIRYKTYSENVLQFQQLVEQKIIL